jgi:hypothetical protein
MEEAVTHIKRELDYYEKQDNPDPKRPCLDVSPIFDVQGGGLPASGGYFGSQVMLDSEALGLPQLNYNNQPNRLSIGYLIDQEQCQSFTSDSDFLDQPIGFDTSLPDWPMLSAQDINSLATLPEYLPTYSLDTAHYESGTLMQGQAMGAGESTNYFETPISASTPSEFGPVSDTLHFAPSLAVEWGYQLEAQDESKTQAIDPTNQDSPRVENAEMSCNVKTRSNLLSSADSGGDSQLDSQSDSDDSKFDTCFGVVSELRCALHCTPLSNRSSATYNASSLYKRYCSR